MNEEKEDMVHLEPARLDAQERHTSAEPSADDILYARLRALEDASRERAWDLHKVRRLSDGHYHLGRAHAFGDAARLLRPPEDEGEPRWAFADAERSEVTATGCSSDPGCAPNSSESKIP